MARVVKVAQIHGFDGFCMMNLYPVRATDYRTLPAKADANAYDENLNQIEKAVLNLHGKTDSKERPVVWAAWGQPVVHHRYFCVPGTSCTDVWRNSIRSGCGTAN